MSENLKGLFNQGSQDATASSGRSLAGTIELTNKATEVARGIMKWVDENFESCEQLVVESQSSHPAMDKLINQAYDLATVDVEFLTELDEATIDGMLKSQQSKRSRAKGKLMTMDNYNSMLVGAVSENLIRLATGREKTAVGRRRVSGAIEYTAEELQALAADEVKLRKEIRNVQSKKSIFKSKEGFSEEDPVWAQILDAEATLKALRDGSKVDATKTKLSELMVGVDIHSLKAADAKSLLEQAMALVGTTEVNSDDSSL